MSHPGGLLPVATPGQTWAAVRVLLARQRRAGALALAVLLASAGFGAVVPALLGRVVDVVATGSGPLVVLVGLLAAAGVVAAALGGLGVWLVARVGQRVLARMREDVVLRVLTLDPARVETGGTGDLVARVSGDVDVVSEAVEEALPALVVSAFTVLFTVVGLGALDWRFAVAAVVVVGPLDVASLRWYLRTSGPRYAAERVAEGARAEQMLVSTSAAATVRAFGLSRAHVADVSARSGDAVARTVATAGARAWLFSRINGTELAGVLALVLTGFLLVRADAVTVGAATAAVLYFLRLFDPIGALLLLFDQAQAAAAALARLQGVRGLDASVAERSRPSRAAVELHVVRHSYDGRHPVLFDVHLELAAGERVALVGTSGAGKTTLARMVAGSITPTEGTVAVDGAVAMVSQEVHVFAGTVAEDLRLARPGASDTELVAALDVVGARAWLDTLDHGLDTRVGEGGRATSPVVAQQLALARVLLSDRPVVVLDEASAEAGSVGAGVLTTAAERVLHGRTALVVAHRLSQAATADRVVVLEHGRVLEQGSHRALVATGGRYAELWSAWTGAPG